MRRKVAKSHSGSTGSPTHLWLYADTRYAGSIRTLLVPRVRRLTRDGFIPLTRKTIPRIEVCFELASELLIAFEFDGAFYRLFSYFHPHQHSVDEIFR